MKPNKEGQIVKFHTLYPGEDPKQRYVVLEIIEDEKRPKTDIKALNTDLSFFLVNTFMLNNLKVLKESTQDLIGHHFTINSKIKWN